MTPPEIDPVTVRLVAQCLNHYVTPGPVVVVVVVMINLKIETYCLPTEARKSKAHTEVYATTYFGIKTEKA